MFDWKTLTQLFDIDQWVTECPLPAIALHLSPEWALMNRFRHFHFSQPPYQFYSFFFLSFCFLFLLIINKDSFSNSARTMVLQFSSFESTDGGWPMGSSCDGWNNPSSRQKYFFVVHHIVHWFPSAPCLLFQGTSCWHSWKMFLTFAEVFLPYPLQDNISFPLRFLFSH